MQNQLGWKAGLSFKTVLDTKHMFDHLVPFTGIRLHFSRSLSLKAVPTFVPIDSAALVHVEAKRRLLSTQCIDRFQYKPAKGLPFDDDLFR